MRGMFGFGLGGEGAGNDVVIVVVLCTRWDVGVLVEDAYDAGGDFVVDDGFVVFAYDVDTEFLAGRIRIDFSNEERAYYRYRLI